ncbi:MAG TPA: lipopolysaccharide kinase InaA family protein, partial [Longimicrobium sp.]|nr:lipopolysaccharide kinase InaA family protein [Longimicrobium sp.]
RILAAVERPRTVGYTAMLATILIPGARDAAAWLANGSSDGKLEVLREAGRQMAAMHEAGVGHPDVHLRNLLVADTDEGPEVWLLDFDKARVHDGAVPRARRATDLRRLARSARKLKADVGAEGWTALKDGYGESWPTGLELR